MKQTIKQTQINTQEKFLKKHLKEIIVTTVVVGGITLSVLLLLKNGDKIAELFTRKHNKAKVLQTLSKPSQAQKPLEMPQKIIEKIVIEKPQITAQIKGHPMKLANGKNATLANQEFIRKFYPEYENKGYTYRKPHERTYNKVA